MRGRQPFVSKTLSSGETTPPACRSLTLRFAVCLLTVVVAFSPAQALDFLTDPGRLAPDDTRPRVIIFGSTSCGWCRKLAADTLTSPLLNDYENRFAWLKIDVDEHEELASRYGVTGLPQTIITDAQGNVIGEKSGYVPAIHFATFLDETLRNPRSTASDLAKWLADLKSSETTLRRESARLLLQHVSRVEGPDRDQAIAALKQHGPAGWSEIAPYLEHPRLSMRAAAGGLLQRVTLANRDFDPFADLPLRSEQSQAWKAWVESQGGTVAMISFVDSEADASAWSPAGNADRPPAPPLAQPLETPVAP